MKLAVYVYVCVRVCVYLVDEIDREGMLSVKSSVATISSSCGPAEPE